MADTKPVATENQDNPDMEAPTVEKVQQEADARDAARKPEVGGPEGPEPTRYGDWEKKGRCVDF